MSSTMHSTAAEAEAAAEAMGCSGSHKMGDMYMTGANHGDCDSDPKWSVVDGGYAPMNLDPGDTITFIFYQHAHDVVSVPTAAELASCDFSAKTVLCDKE